MRRIPPSAVKPGHVNYDVCRQLADIITGNAGGEEQLRATVPSLIRRAIDEVIDTPRTGRLLLDEIEKTEKTYIGTKIEILIRDFLGFPKGRLDLEIDGQDVDIKYTSTGSWMIPAEAIDHPCILLLSDEDTRLCFLGIFVAHDEYLNPGANRDGKKGISVAGLENVLWLLRDLQYPANFWADVSQEDAAYINDMKNTGGTERLRRLFRRVQGIPVSRSVIEGVARQRDYMKRLRKNGGARDPLLREGIAILSGKYNRDAIAELGLPECTPDEFVSISIDSDARREILDRNGYFDYD